MASEMESYSITPPLSPFLRSDPDLEQDAEIQNIYPEDIQVASHGKNANCHQSVCFMCGGKLEGIQKIKFNKDSILNTGCLQKKLNCTTVDKMSKETLIELFGYQFVTQLALANHMEKLFMFAQNCILEVQKTSIGFTDAERTALMSEYRKQLKRFLDYVHIYVKNYADFEGQIRDSFYRHLFSHLHSLLLLSGRLAAQSFMEHDNIKSSGVGSQYFHMQLDLYCSLLHIYHFLHYKLADFTPSQHLCRSRNEELGEDPYFKQLVSIIFWDLVHVAAIKHDKLSPADYLKVSSFPCSCVAELVIIIIHLTTELHNHDGQDSFWVQFHSVVQTLCQGTDVNDQLKDIDSDVVIIPSLSLPKNPVSFSMWLVTHIAHLFTYDVVGNSRTLGPLDSSYLLLKNIMQKKLSETSVTEAELRAVLRCCLSLTNIWKPDTTILIQLWEFFYRRLNNTFQLSGTSVEGLASISQNTHFLLDQCRKWSSGQENGIDKENSFQLFLCLLGWQLSRLVKAGSLQEWRQIKGRFFSKFHQRRMQELTESGLQNFTCLFLTLALSTDLEDVTSKLCTFYDMVECVETSIQKRCLVWLGGLSLAQIYTERGKDMAFLAENLVHSFNSVCQEFSESELDPSRRHSLWKMISLYLEAVQDIFENSENLDCSEHILLGNGIGFLLPVGRDNELRFILMTFYSVLSTFRKVFLKINSCQGDRLKTQFKNLELQYIALSPLLWNHVYLFIKEHSTTRTPPMCLADLAAVICLLCKDLSSLQSPTNNFKTVFFHFANADNVHVGISCHFLSQILDEEGVLDWMLVRIPGVQVQLIQSWFRCVMIIPASFQELQNITKIVMKLPDIKEIFSSASISPSEEVEPIPKIFLKMLGKVYFKCENFREKMILRDKVMNYFMNVPRQVTPVLRVMGPTEIITTMYTTVGQLIKYCAPMLYVQSKTNCPLPVILEAMIVPHFLFNTNKLVSPVFLGAVKESLHLFMHGFSRLDYRRDPYLQRRLKDIISIYLTKFSLKSQGSSSTTVVHPLVSSLNESFVKSPSNESVSFRQYVLELVHCEYLQLKNLTVPQSASVGLAYVTEVLQRTNSGELIARDIHTLLRTMLEYVLLAGSSAMKKHAVHIMQYLVEACKKHPNIVSLPELSSVVKNFLTLSFNIQYEGVLKIMEKLSLIYQDLVINLISDMTQAVHSLENKRGSGIDKRLRNCYFSVLQQLGEQGLREISKLKEMENMDMELDFTSENS